jgi:hypothetical protein
MKTKITKILGVALTVTILASLLITTVASPAMAGDRKWTKSNPPAAGADGDWFWHDDIDQIGPVAKTADGVLLCYMNKDGNHWLMKSSDMGRTWGRIKKYTTAQGGIAGEILDFAVDPTDGESFYALDDNNKVWRTTDMGASFVSITETGLVGTLNSIDFNWVGGNAYLFGGTNNDAFRFDEYEYGATWQVLGLNAYAGGPVNVLDIRTSPNFSDEVNPMVMALYTYAGDTFVDYKYGSGDWGSLTGQVTLSATGSADDGRFNETFPADFDSDNATGQLEYWVVLDDGNVATQGIYRVVGAVSFNKNNDTDFISCDFAGNVGSGSILAGTDDGNIYRCNDGVGGTWVTARNVPYGPPGSTGDVWVIMGDDYLEDDFAVAAMNDPAVFVYQPVDRQWVGQSLAELELSTIGDIAFGSTRFQIIHDTGLGPNYTALLRHDGTNWDILVWGNQNSIDGVVVSDEFDTDETVFYWNGIQLARSTNTGNRFINQLSTPGNGATQLTAVHAFNSSTLLICHDTGTHTTGNNGTTWGNHATNFTDGVSLAVNPEDSDEVLAGDDNGDIWKSSNKGKTWAEVKKGTKSIAGGSDVYVAFDPTDTSRYFAAGEDGGGNLAIDRFGADGWLDIDPPAGGAATGIVVTEGCSPVLYTTDDVNTGVIRTLNPQAKVANILWENVTKGGPDNLFDLNLVEGSIVLFAAGIGTNHVWTFTDTLVVPVEGVSTVVDADTQSVLVTWSAMDGADRYQVQVSGRDDFDGTIDDASVAATGYRFFLGIPGGTYFVRVRVEMGEPFLSCWSATASFQKAMGPQGWNPFQSFDGSIGNVAPPPGSKGVDPIQPLFQWNPGDDAASYEFQLATNAAFAGADTKVVKSPTYIWPGDLEYGTVYYWRVRAIKANGAVSEWAMGVFTTMEEAVPEQPPVVVAPPQPAPPPQYIPTTYIPEYILWVIVGIGALLIIALLILIMKTRRVA